MNDTDSLPPGQHEIEDMPRFGLTKFASRFPNSPEEIAIEVGGDVRNAVRLTTELADLERVDQVSDFHCVTTWTKRNMRWSGFRFADFYKQLVISQAQPDPEVRCAVFRGQDGYRVGMQLEDLLASNVLLVDRLDGQVLPVAHGAPLRLVAPAHYGYKNAKHIMRIDFLRSERSYRPAAFKFMDHPRARVEFEERGSFFPGWLLRRLYRPLIEPTKRKFERALEKHLATSKSRQ